MDPPAPGHGSHDPRRLTLLHGALDDPGKHRVLDTVVVVHTATLWRWIHGPGRRPPLLISTEPFSRPS